MTAPGRSRQPLRQVLADLRAGRAFLATELSQPGWLDFGAFRWHDLARGRAVRGTIGVITPLAIGIATGHVEFGSFAALGALPTGFVAFRGVARSRVLAIVLAAAGMAVSTFVGAATDASHPWLLVPIIFIWSYMVGLLAALGPTALAITLQWPIALLIASALPLSPGEAGVRALLVLAGGLWQGLLVITSWALAPGNSERTAMAASFLALGNYAADLTAGTHDLPDETTVAGGRAVSDPNPMLRSVARQQLIDLSEEAERIRGSLIGLVISRPDGPDPEVRDLLMTAGRVLREIAAALTARPPRREGPLEAAREELGRVTLAPGTEWHWAGEALLGQLRAACRIAGRLDDAEPARPGQRRTTAPWSAPGADVADMLLTLRAGLSTRSEAGRHALRLAVVTAVAEVIIQAAGLPHGYWAVITIFIVLRPDYSSTLYRGLQRAAGTVVGVGLGILTVHLGRFGDGALLAGTAVALLAAYAVFAVNYLLYAVFLTDFVVVLLALLGLPPDPTAVARLVGTGIGTGLAVLAYVLWPTWERTSATEKFARLFAAQGEYASAELRAYTRPGHQGLPALADLRLAVRRARTDADASADRLAGEPGHRQMTGALGRSLSSAAHRIGLSSIALTAAVAVHQAAAANGGNARLRRPLDELADGVDAATGLIARVLREQAALDVPAPVPPLPPLRAQQEAVTAAAGARPAVRAGGDGEEASGLVAATDGLVDSINTVADILRRTSAQQS
jgi:uncharacterized membrane protein YccC